MTRRTLLWTAAALLGIVATAAVAWSASRLAGQHVGLSSEPLSVVSGLAPHHTRAAARARRAPKSHQRAAPVREEGPLATTSATGAPAAVIAMTPSPPATVAAAPSAPTATPSALAAAKAATPPPAPARTASTQRDDSQPSGHSGSGGGSSSSGGSQPDD